jgi:hypothetical protein
VDLLVLDDDAVQDAQAVDPARAVRLDIGPIDPPPVVTGDEPRLRQVLSNLVGNALRHIPATSAVTVRVATEPGGQAVVLTVADEGPGIPAEHVAQVFERFYRADPAREGPRAAPDWAWRSSPRWSPGTAAASSWTPDRAGVAAPTDAHLRLTVKTLASTYRQGAGDGRDYAERAGLNEGAAALCRTNRFVMLAVPSVPQYGRPLRLTRRTGAGRLSTPKRSRIAATSSGRETCGQRPASTSTSQCRHSTRWPAHQHLPDRGVATTS